MMDVWLASFSHGRRGPMSTFMVRNTDKEIAFGTVFYNEVGGEGLTTGAAALKWCETHAQKLWHGLLVLEDDGIYPGWATNPVHENEMLERAKKLAGWE